MQMHERFAVTQRASVEYGNRLAEWLDRISNLGWFYVFEQMSLGVASLAREADGRGQTFVNEPITIMRAVKREFGLTDAEALRIMHNAFSSWFNFPVRTERHGDDPDAKADLA